MDYDLTAGSGASVQAAARTSLSSVFDPSQNLVRISYIGTDAHLHTMYLSGQSWLDYDLTANAGGVTVAAGTSLSSVFDSSQDLARINYVGTDAHIHTIYLGSGRWLDYDLTAGAGASVQVAAGASLSSVFDPSQNLVRINYVGTDAHLHTIYPSGSSWLDYDLTANAGGVAIPGNS